MGNLLGSSAQDPAPAAPAPAAKREVSEADKATLKIKLQRDKLKTESTRVAFMVEKRRAAAKQLAKDGKKEKAMLMLKTKKMMETQLANCENQLFQVEQMVASIDEAGIQLKVVEGLKVRPCEPPRPPTIRAPRPPPRAACALPRPHTEGCGAQAGTAALKELQKQIGSVEEVQDLMDETAEAQAYQQEVADALQGSITMDDEADIEAELAELEAMEALELGVALDELPAVPSTVPDVAVAEPVAEPEVAAPAARQPARQMVAA